jgi:hypothetical protein
MKEIIISPERLRKELYFLLASFGIALLLNVYSIIKYQTNWVEIITQIGYVFLLSLLFYLILLLVRGSIVCVKSIVKGITLNKHRN